MAIRDIDRQYNRNPSPELLKRRLDLQTEFDLITTTDAERLLLRSRSSYYEHGDKASRLLAHQLRRQAASRTISQIKNASGSLVTDPKGINDIFKSFYSSLYCSESPSDISDMTLFLQNLEAPTLDPRASEILDSPLTLEEVVASVKAMQNNKAPGRLL